MDLPSNLSTTGSNSPTIFELLGADKLNELLFPALGQLMPNKQYLQLFGLFGIQLYYLNVWKGTFAEVFYGLKRQKMNTGKFQLFMSLTEAVVYPLCKFNLSTFYDKTRLQRLATRQIPLQNPTCYDRVKLIIIEFFMKVWPIVKSLEGAAQVLVQIAYVYNMSPYSSLWQIVFKGYNTTRLTADDYVCRIVINFRDA